MIPKYKVGDVVQVVPTPYKDCPFNWADDMDEWCGRTVVITDCRYSDAYSAYLYHIELHQSESERGFLPTVSRPWSWCENCFVPIGADTTSEDFEVSEIDVLLGGDW